MGGLRGLHEANAWALIGTNALVGVWCLVAYRSSGLRGRPVWAGVIVAQSTTFVQAVLGAVLSRRDGVVLNDMHALYGFSAIIAVAIMYSYRTSPFMKGKELVLYGFGSLFVMGLGLRNLVLV
jgi:uncharacterized membrane protein YhdT